MGLSCKWIHVTLNAVSLSTILGYGIRLLLLLLLEFTHSWWSCIALLRKKHHALKKQKNPENNETLTSPLKPNHPPNPNPRWLSTKPFFHSFSDFTFPLLLTLMVSSTHRSLCSDSGCSLNRALIIPSQTMSSFGRRSMHESQKCVLYPHQAALSPPKDTQCTSNAHVS